MMIENRLVLFLLVLASLAVRAEDIVVVVNSGGGVESLSRDEVVGIFLGGIHRFSSGVAALPVDLPRDDPVREEFYRRLVGKTSPEINTHWLRLVCSAKTQPPVQAGSVEDARTMVLESAGAITYIERGKADGRLKIVFTLSP
jgi:ABC-type phosphate transport system substrate-binding protein